MKYVHTMDTDHYAQGPQRLKARLRPRHVKALTRAEIRRERDAGPAVVVQVGGVRGSREAPAAAADERGLTVWQEPIGEATAEMHLDAALGFGVLGGAVAIIFWLPNVMQALMG